jgi:superfamily II DNA or RNA helicase
VWQDDSPESIQWVQEEFEALWNHPCAQPLADFVIEDIGRLANRQVVPSVEVWREESEPFAPIAETPVFRRELGLWEHQKYFVHLAFEWHKRPEGARFVLADMVGLGKTIQLATSALLMALTGDMPILVIAPKTLLWQWQEELQTLLDFPSAVWNGKSWVDENGIEYPSSGPEGIRKCPRRLGIISQGLITHGSDSVEYLKSLRYECIIVDEAHKARRKNLGPDKEGETPEPNNLLAFLKDISPLTKSMLLATATPVQMYPVEAWDLLDVLSVNNDYILGKPLFSRWRRPADCLPLVLGQAPFPEDENDQWEWMRNPFPPASEGRDFQIIRQSMSLKDTEYYLTPESWNSLSQRDRHRLKNLAPSFAQNHNPFIRHIVRRTRDFLENTIDPDTGEPYLKPVRVQLLGERDEDAVVLPTYLKDAYELAEQFCQQLARRVKGSGFLKTLLLRRVCSSIEAGLHTAQRMLGSWEEIDEIDSEEDDDLEQFNHQQVQSMRTLTPTEQQLLAEFVAKLEANKERDPKYEVVRKLLMDESWLEYGCIIFSQYFDSIWWLAHQLSKDLPNERIGIYAGSGRSGYIENGLFQACERETLKQQVRKNELRLLLGTDAASEGLNLQRLGTLINFDLPWNPTRLEQRKGRIQRIGQLRDTVLVYNMRYKDSVEDRVHDLLSDRLENIHQLFGQIPDILEDAWINVALGDLEAAKQTINAIPSRHPFELRYHKLEKVHWDTCHKVLNSTARKHYLSDSW